MSMLSSSQLQSRAPFGRAEFERPVFVPGLVQVRARGDEPHTGGRNAPLAPRDARSTNTGGPVVQINPVDGARRSAMAWPGMRVEIIQITSEVNLRFRAAVDLLVAYEEGERRAGDTFVEGLPRSALRQVGRKITIVPANSEFQETYDPRTPGRLIFVYFDRPETDHGLDLTKIPLSPRLFFEDAPLWGTVLKLKQSLESHIESDRLYAKALGAVLLHELARLNGSASPLKKPARGGLAPWQQRAVTSYMDEHMGEQVSLATLAQLVRLSPYYFCRAFKKSFGVPPHRYYNNRRIQQAKELLLKQGSSVTETGLALGFSETSSFSAAFRRETGLTPTEYRRTFA